MSVETDGTGWIGAANGGMTRAAKLRPAVEDPPDFDDGLVHFDGASTRFRLEPDHDRGCWVIQVFDEAGHRVVFDLPRGEAWQTAHSLTLKLEQQQFQAPRPERWVGKTPI